MTTTSNTPSKTTGKARRWFSAESGEMSVAAILWLAVALFGAFTVATKGGEFSDGFAASYCSDDRSFGLEGERFGCSGNGPATDGRTFDHNDNFDVAAGS